MTEKDIDVYIKAALCRHLAGLEEITVEDVKQAYQDGYEKRVEEETEAAETSNDCTNCKYYSEMPSGKHCQECDNGSKFKEA